MKKLLTVLLIMTMSISLLVGCGGSDKDTNKEPNKGNNTSQNQDADGNQDGDFNEDADSEEQNSGFTGEEVTYTTYDKKIKVIYDEDIIRVVKAEDGYALKLGLVGKYYSESFDLLKHSVQSFYESEKNTLEAKVATPEVTDLNVTPEDKEGTGNVETSVFKMTRTYTNATVGEPEKITVASGMNVYRIEEKYTMTTTYEKISGSAEDKPEEVFESDKYIYMIDLGDNCILKVFSFQVDAQSVDREPMVDAIEKVLNAIYVEIVTE